MAIAARSAKSKTKTAGGKATGGVGLQRRKPITKADEEEAPANSVSNNNNNNNNEDDGWDDIADDDNEGGNNNEDGSFQHASKKAKYDKATNNGSYYQQQQQQQQKAEQAIPQNHREQRELRRERKAQKPFGTIMMEAKRLWEPLRCKETSKEERIKVMKQMMETIKGNVAKIALKHDCSRVLQTILKWGSSNDRNEIAKELSGHTLDLAKTLYGRFILFKLLKYCPTFRPLIIKDLYGSVRKLIRHKEASEVIEEAYTVYANKREQFALVEEFYGPEFALFKSGGNKHSLQDILSEYPEKRSTVMKHLREALVGALNKQNTARMAIIHRALFDYLEQCVSLARTPADAVDYEARRAEGLKLAHEMLEDCKERVAEFVHTKEGSRAAALLVAFATPKDRKALAKHFSSYTMDLCKEEYGHLVMLQVFESFDDTKLVKTSFLSTIGENVKELALDKYGRRVLLHLLTGRARRYQSKDIIDTLIANDDVRRLMSKKDDPVRRRELLEAISKELCEFVAKYPGRLLFNPELNALVTETLLHARGATEQRKKVCDALIALVADADSIGRQVEEAEEDENDTADADADAANGNEDSDDDGEDGDDEEDGKKETDSKDDDAEEEDGEEDEDEDEDGLFCHPLEHSVAHRTFAFLIKASHKPVAKADPSMPDDEPQDADFAQLVLDALPTSHLAHFATGAGAFAILMLLEAPSTAEKLKKLLSADKDAVKALKETSSTMGEKSNAATILKTLGVGAAAKETPKKSTPAGKKRKAGGK